MNYFKDKITQRELQRFHKIFTDTSPLEVQLDLLSLMNTEEETPPW